MKKLFDLLGTDVISPVDGKRFGTIADIVVEKNGLLKINGFIIDSDGNNSKFTYIPWYAMRFGENAALCSHYEPREYESDSQLNGLFRMHDLMDKRVYTNEGREIGLLKDMFLSEDEGLVEGLQCSDGLINDILNGRTVYPLVGRFEIGNDSIILSRESFEEAILRNK